MNARPWHRRWPTFAIVCLILATLAAPAIAPFNPYDSASLDLLDAELPPIWQTASDERFLLGTDEQGRDLFSAMIYGARTSLLIGLAAVALQVVLGTLLGLLAGYRGGHSDALIMRLADIQMAFSTLLLAIIALALFRIGLTDQLYEQYAAYILIGVIGLAEWPPYARAVRAGVLAEKDKDYITAARLMGASPLRIALRHLLPNVANPVFVLASVQVAAAMMNEAALSFLGLGMPPTRPSLGTLINNGYDYLFSGSWWISLLPGAVLVILILLLNSYGDWLRDRFQQGGSR